MGIYRRQPRQYLIGLKSVGHLSVQMAYTVGIQPVQMAYTVGIQPGQMAYTVGIQPGQDPIKDMSTKISFRSNYSTGQNIYSYFVGHNPTIHIDKITDDFMIIHPDEVKRRARPGPNPFINVDWIGESMSATEFYNTGRCRVEHVKLVPASVTGSFEISPFCAYTRDEYLHDMFTNKLREELAEYIEGIDSKPVFK